MLLATVLLWALNVSVTKYILEHGLPPLSYASARYALAGLIFVALALAAERTLRIQRRHLPRSPSGGRSLAEPALVRPRPRWTTATTIGLLLGAIPIFTALLGLALGRERLTRNFWIAAAISAVGVALVASAPAETSPAASRGCCSGSPPARPGRRTRSPSRR